MRENTKERDKNYDDDCVLGLYRTKSHQNLDPIFSYDNDDNGKHHQQQIITDYHHSSKIYDSNSKRPASVAPPNTILSDSNIITDAHDQPHASSSSLREHRKLITIEDQEHEERVFKQDLAHILAWFQDDLNEEQRLTTVYSLMKQLDTWQVSFLARLLENEDNSQQGSINNNPISPSSSPTSSTSSYNNNSNSNNDNDNNHFKNENVHVDSNNSTIITSIVCDRDRDCYSPINCMDNNHISSPSSITISSSSNGEQLEIYANLFWSGDISGWLKALRLHKYSYCFINKSLTDILYMDENKLMEIGILTLGARRKFLRIITALKSCSI